MTHLTERWTVIDGSVYTEEAYLRQVAGGEVKYRPGIAFNVGQMVAEHMVRLHNASLLGDLELDLPPDVMASLLADLRNPAHVLLVHRSAALPPPHDSLEEAQRAAGMSSVMQVQGSSLRPVEIRAAVVAPKPCCGCRKV